MEKSLFDSISSGYGLKIASYAPAPRQWVAETLILRIADGRKLFCKLVNKPLWIPKIIDGLPVLDAMHQAGLDRINFPVRTISNELYLMADGGLVVLYNYIEAPQSYEYDNESFGRLVGQVHAITPMIKVQIPKESFSFKDRGLFERQFFGTLSSKSQDSVTKSLQKLLREHEAEIQHYYETLQKLMVLCKQQPFDMVITHGDAGGNVLVKSPTDLYIVDWDEILLAPRERDLWVSDINADFIKGYKSIFPGYRSNETARNFCICNQYFYYLIYYFEEILGEFGEEYRRSRLDGLANYFHGWIRPYIESIN